jgi:hypothetical protein
VIQVEHVHEKVLVSSLLFEAIGKASATIDSFSNWLLAGFAAAITFMLGNFEALSSHVSNWSVRYCAYLFIGVLVLGIGQKLLATLVAAASAGAALGRKMGNENAERGIELDPDAIFSEMERAILPPMRRFVTSSFAKVKRGDLTAAARSFSVVAQIQGILVAVQVVCVLRAVYVLATEMAF